ncbi:MAG: magnesium chelatase ATPase subunit I [Paracoccaceae bacterium]
MTSDYPFSAIVGQNTMKQSLILTAIDPLIGGVLVFGERGTGKSTIVRSLTALLPEIKSIKGCPYNCEILNKSCPHCSEIFINKIEKKSTPIIDLPLGSTEDRVVGSLNLEVALSEGKKSFEPGLLAYANRGYLYIDEVNLLEDHIVDLLLDVSASGENLIEREGLSIKHDSKFVLVGSGNPEEGELRPQLLDRFGLSVEVKSPTELEERIEVIKRRTKFDEKDKDFLDFWEKEDSKLRRRIIRAKKKLLDIKVSNNILENCAKLCLALGSDGLRGELTLIRASKAQASFENKDSVEIPHLRKVALICMGHRLRKDPLDDVGSNIRIERTIEEILGK